MTHRVVYLTICSATFEIFAIKSSAMSCLVFKIQQIANFSTLPLLFTRRNFTMESISEKTEMTGLLE